MNFQQSVKSAISKTFQFKGRASRSEFWWFSLLISVVFIILLSSWDLIFKSESLLPFAPFIAILPFILLIPSISLTVRRLHDLNLSGWWYTIYIIPKLLNTTTNEALKFGISGIGYQFLQITAITISIAIYGAAFYYFSSRGTIGANDYGSDPIEEIYGSENTYSNRFDSNKKLITIIGIFAITLIGGLLAFNTGLFNKNEQRPDQIARKTPGIINQNSRSSRTSMPIEDQLIALAREVNKKTPVKIGEDLIFTTMVAVDKNLFYDYNLFLDYKDIDPVTLHKWALENVNDQTCKDEFLVQLFNDGAVVSRRFYTKDNKLVDTINLNEICVK